MWYRDFGVVVVSRSNNERCEQQFRWWSGFLIWWIPGTRYYVGRYTTSNNCCWLLLLQLFCYVLVTVVTDLPR